MTYLQLAYLHLLSVVPAFFIGSYLLLNRKGTRIHKALGKVYLILMLLTALISLLMKAEVGPRIVDHFGFIHLFSFFVLYSVPAAILAVRNQNLSAHKSHMIGVYVGGLLIAGGFAFSPGRLLHNWIFM